MDELMNEQIQHNCFSIFSDSRSGVREVSIDIGATPNNSDLLPWNVITTSDWWSCVSVDIYLMEWMDKTMGHNGKINIELFG